MAEKRSRLQANEWNSSEKAYSLLPALDADQIYGTPFTREADMVSGIGSNVSFVFKDMDFGADGCMALTICGHSSIEKNSIQIHFDQGNEEGTELIEFPKTDSLTEKTFPITPFFGKHTISIVFPPGSQFDLSWIRFSKER